MTKREMGSRSIPVMAGGLTLALLLFLVGGQALASHVQPEVVRGSPTCSDYSTGTEFTISASERFGVADSGEYTDGTFTVNVTFHDTSSGQEFDWVADMEVDVIVAKGGSLASIYRYDPRVTSDRALHSPFNDTRSLWYPSTYISFCYHPPSAGPTVSEPTTTTELVVETTQPGVLATTTTSPAEVLPSVVTTSVPPSSSTTAAAGATTTSPAEVKGTEVLPFTGMADETLWILAISLVAAGSTAVFSARRSRQEDE